MSINIDLSRDSLFDDHGLTRLKDSYMRDDESSPQERLAFVSKSFASNDEHAQRMYDYSSKHWLSYASPVLAFGKSKNGLPISCFLPYLHDSAEGLVECLSEVNWLSMLGGGIGIGVGIRSSDKKSVGIMPHMRTYDASCLAYRQGQTRRGSYATYLDINHPDIMMFLEMRRPTGDPNMRCLNLHHGVNITDDFMNLIEASMKDSSVDDSWELRDPDNDTVKEVVSARALWERIIDLRIQTGEPYLHFIDTSNRALNPWQKKLGLKIKQSNLCLTGETIIEITRHPVIGNIERIQLDDFIEKWNLGFYDTVFVRSYDQTTRSFCFKKILAAAKTADVTELIRIETEDGRVIECTPEHKIWTNNRGWVEAQYLKEDDDLITQDKKRSDVLKITRVCKPEPIAVFDIKVEETESFMANGILVHNCGEIIECTDKDRTAVCCLSSLNLEYFDEWKNDHQFYRDVAEFLDNVLEYFIKKAPSAIKRAKYSAMRERSIGIGALGFHAYLQKNMIPFEGVMAKSANNRMFSTIEKHLKKVNKELGEERGSPPDLEGSGLRFANMTAIAPNATSSIIMRNTSPSIEPFRANAYRQDTISGSYLNKNRHLDKLIKKKCEEDPKIKYDETWSSIISNDGSVQHLKFLDDLEKDTFKTAMEIDQRWIIEHAADRQQYIDQSQSVNLFFRPNANISYVHAVHFLAWQKSMKTLYYCRSEKLSKTDKIAKQIERQIIEELDMSQVADGEVCLACEG